MSQTTKIIAGVVALIVGAIAVGWIYFQLSPDAWEQFTAEMAGEGGSTRPEAQTVVRRPSRTEGELMASGSIEAEDVTVAAELGGLVVETGAGEGDTIAEGDLLLRLDPRSLLAQQEGALATVEQAGAALDAAEAQLAQAQSGATTEEIAAARAAVLAAEGASAAAKATLTQAEIGANSARTVEQAESSVAMADALLAQADAAMYAAKQAGKNRFNIDTALSPLADGGVAGPPG